MRYVTKHLDVLKTSTDTLAADPDSLGLPSTILKEALRVYLIYAVEECGNNKENTF